MTMVTSSFLAGAEMMTFFAPASTWALAFGGVGEEAGRLDHDVGAEVAPGQLARVPLGERLEGLATDGDLVGGRLHLVRRRPRMMSYFSRWASVALSVRSLTPTISMSAPDAEHGPEEVTADAAEAVDANPDGHRSHLLAFWSAGGQTGRRRCERRPWEGRPPIGSSGRRGPAGRPPTAASTARSDQAAGTVAVRSDPIRATPRRVRAGRNARHAASDGYGAPAGHHLRGDGGLGVRDAQVAGPLVGQGEQPPDPAGDGVLGQRRVGQRAQLLQRRLPVLQAQPAGARSGGSAPRRRGSPGPG